MRKILLLLPLITFSAISYSQNLDDLDSYTVDKGDYKIDLTDGDGDLYEVKDTNIYIKFNGYFGYAGYSKECIMKVDYYSAKVYKLE